MTTWSNLQRVGTYGATGVESDLVAELGDGLYHPALIGVTLTQAYHPMRPPGYPTRNSPGHILMPGMTVQPGATLWLLKPEAEALVAANAATYSDIPPPVDQKPQPLPPQTPAPYVAPACSGPSGNPAELVGVPLTCSQGTWQHAPTDFAYQWWRTTAAWVSTLIDGETASSYLTSAADDQAYVFCNVTGSNSAGSAQSASNVIWIAFDLSAHPAPQAAATVYVPRDQQPGRRR
jgi:hypothetical protein